MTTRNFVIIAIVGISLAGGCLALAGATGDQGWALPGAAFLALVGLANSMWHHENIRSWATWTIASAMVLGLVAVIAVLTV